MKLFSTTAIALLSLQVFPCGAFIPNKSWSKGKGLLGTTHSDMTRNAWRQLARQLFQDKAFTQTMEAALTTVDNAQIAVDDDQKRAHLHFDGESFPEAQGRLVNLVAQAVNAIKANQAPEARGLVGAALHSVQDFYAHSNWIELGNRAPHPDLGVAGRTIGRLAESVATCVDCEQEPRSLTCNHCNNNFKNPSPGLTSGYYGGEDREKPNVHKCSHGGIFDRHRPINTGFFKLRLLVADGINKDSTDCTLSPHFHLHKPAADVAIDGSVAFLRLITSKLTDDEKRLLFAVGSSVTVLNNAKARRALDLHPEASTLVARGVSDATHMIEAFGRTIRARIFDGQLHQRRGLEERADESIPALYDIVAKADRDSYVFVYADTGADISAIDADHAKGIATYRAITINMFLFGGNTPSIHPEVVSLCQQTGGQVFVLGQSETSVADTIVKRLGVDSSVDILRAYDSQSSTYKIPVDSTLSNVTISVSGSTTVVLTRPDGSQVDNSSIDVSTLAYSTGTFMVITTTTIGTWKLRVTPTDGIPFSVSVVGVSFLDFDFDFVEISGRPGHQGDQVQASFPFSNQSVGINARIYETFKDAAFYARSLTGDLNQTFHLTQGEAVDDAGGFTPNTFYNNPDRNNFTLGEDPFLVYLTGLDVAGNAFQRAQDVVYSPTQINIEQPSPNTIHPGSHRNLTFSIQNYQLANETFNVTILSGSGFVVPGFGQTAIRGGVTQVLEVPTALAKDLTVYINIPSTATIGTDIVSVYIRGQKNIRNINYSLAYLWVVPGDPLDDAFTWDGFSYGKNHKAGSIDDPDNADAKIYEYGVAIDELALF